MTNISHISHPPAELGRVHSGILRQGYAVTSDQTIGVTGQHFGACVVDVILWFVGRVVLSFTDYCESWRGAFRFASIV
jgi:hypothetical protein